MKDFKIKFNRMDELEREHETFLKSQYHKSNLADFPEQLSEIAEWWYDSTKRQQQEEDKYVEEFYYTDTVMKDGIPRAFEFEILANTNEELVSITYLRCFEY